MIFFWNRDYVSGPPIENDNKKKCFLEACGAILLNIRFAWELFRILVKDSDSWAHHHRF